MAKKVKRLVFETIGESYTQQEIVGEGFAGIVYKVTDSAGKQFALKCLRPGQATTSRSKRFMNELRFCENDNHVNLIRVLDHGFIILKEKKCPYYVMPLYPSTLRTLIKKALPPDKVLTYFAQILDGVEAAHFQGVWHRDLKPENILCNPTEGSLVVSDFGVAHFTEEIIHTIVKTKPGDRLANFQYSAPEQRDKTGKVDNRADVYALGLIMNEMFTGSVIQGTGFQTIGKTSPEYAFLDDIVDRMVQQDPSARPQSVDEIKQLLAAENKKFVSRQKLNTLNNTVVKASDVVDKIVAEPVRVVGFDVVGNTLQLELNHFVPPYWIQAFRSIVKYSFIAGSSPHDWQFRENKASVPLSGNVHETTGQMIIDNFKRYVSKANDAYKAHLVQEAIQLEREEQQRLEKQIADAKSRDQMLRQWKI